MKENGLNRRDFLKLAGLGMAAAAFGPGPEARIDEFSPEIVNGVEVYGLRESIDTKEDMWNLVEELDRKFLQIRDPKSDLVSLGYGFDEIRDILLPQNERYLTMVVKRSVYESYERNKELTGVDYPTWVQNHVDLANRMLSNANVPTEAHVTLRRIIVVDDSFEGENMKRYPMDTDAVWFEKIDYRFGLDRPAYMWKYKVQEGGGVIFYRVTDDEGYYEEPVLFSSLEFDSLSSQGSGEVDMGLIHEIVNHLLFNNDDPYTRNIHQKVFGDEFRLGGWYMQRPEISAEILLVINENIRRAIRGYYSDPEGLGRSNKDFYLYSLIQEKIEIGLVGGEGLEIHESWYAEKTEGGGNGIYYQNEKFHHVYSDAAFDGKFETIHVDEYFGSRYDLENGEFTPLTYLLRTKVDGEVKNLFFPRFLFNLAYTTGSKDKVKFRIKFEKDSNMYARVFGKLQEMSFVKTKDLKEFKKKLWNRQDPIRATMKFPGTDLYCVWYYTKRN